MGAVLGLVEPLGQEIAEADASTLGNRPGQLLVGHAALEVAPGRGREQSFPGTRASGRL
jgi:hypothetical protein